MQKGFTLIEMLVVVLVIGILAAFAVPYYENAVDQTRYSNIKTLVGSVRGSIYMAQIQSGRYPSDWDQLDVQLPKECTAVGGAPAICKKETLVLYEDGALNIVGYNDANQAQALNAYVAWLKDSAYPGRLECWARTGNSRAARLCDAQGGVLTGKTASSGCPQCDIYLLP